jgi:hypothetical protein
MVIGTDYTGIEIQLLYTQFHDSPLINMNYIDHINILQKIYVFFFVLFFLNWHQVNNFFSSYIAHNSVHTLRQ